VFVSVSSYKLVSYLSWSLPEWSTLIVPLSVGRIGLILHILNYLEKISERNTLAYLFVVTKDISGFITPNSLRKILAKHKRSSLSKRSINSKEIKRLRSSTSGWTTRKVWPSQSTGRCTSATGETSGSSTPREKLKS
jgi:hypothetical protein